ncbi:MAG: hypothetical protein Q9162_005515 [Coniocarpon cinnabarinum]
MATERLASIASHILPYSPKKQPTQPHPLEPLSADEIDCAVRVIRREKAAALDGHVAFNAISLREPPKADMIAWLSNKTDSSSRPPRVADCVVIGRGSKVYDGLVDLSTETVTQWDHTPGVQPLITMEDLQLVEKVCRTDSKVIDQCAVLGINDMSKVYCDPWTIGYDARFGSAVRLQQALMYYRPHIDDSQYTYPLDFCPIFNADTHEIIHIDVPDVRRPLNTAPATNFAANDEKSYGGYREDLKPLHITQPQGVSFNLQGHELSWLNWRLSIGFNYREGITLHNVRWVDKDEGGVERPIIWRISLAEMVVPYGNPEHPHQRKHAFDLGEYGGGYMTNDLGLGCDCKGAIAYLPFHHVTKAGETSTIKHAVCIHEEDSGILFKHTDFRDNASTVTRARKLIMSHVFTAANYEYAVYWILHMDGTIQLEIKLTGILNTYAMLPNEDLKGYGTQVYPGVNAHNHQHLFCLRIDPSIDGHSNSVLQSDAVPISADVGTDENPHGNGFVCRKTLLQTQGDSKCDYDSSTSRTWDFVNRNKRNPYSGNPVSYKLVSREVPRLLPKENSLVWRRAGFARHAIHVTKYDDAQLHPAGRHVPQTSGEPNLANRTLVDWIESDPSGSIVDQDVVVWHTFGITHFPAPEDFPIMPAEPMTLLLRPRNFFKRNPALDVRPSASSWPSVVNKGGVNNADGCSKCV